MPCVNLLRLGCRCAALGAEPCSRADLRSLPATVRSESWPGQGPTYRKLNFRSIFQLTRILANLQPTYKGKRPTYKGLCKLKSGLQGLPDPTYKENGQLTRILANLQPTYKGKRPTYKGPCKLKLAPRGASQANFQRKCQFTRILANLQRHLVS